MNTASFVASLSAGVRERPYNFSCLSAVSKNRRLPFRSFSRLWAVIWRVEAFRDQQCQFLTRIKGWAAKTNHKEAQWPIGYGVGFRIKRSSVRIRPWPLRWVLGQGSLLPLSQGEAFTLASISYLAILGKYILAKKKKKKKKTVRWLLSACVPVRFCPEAPASSSVDVNSRFSRFQISAFWSNGL